MKIFIPTYGGGHVNLLVPVIKKLLSEKKHEVSILGLSIASNVLKQNELSHKKLVDYFPQIDQEVDRLGRACLERWYVDGKGITLEESILYFGLSLRDLIRNVGEEEAQKRMDSEGKWAFIPTYAAKEILEKESPNLILTGCCPRFERAFTIVGKDMSIPTINMVDYMEFMPRHKMEADYLAVMSDIVRDNLIKQGYEHDQIIITGQPAFDTILNELSEYDPVQIKKELGISTEKKVVLLATQPVMNIPLVMKIVLNTVKKLNNIFLVIRPHPGEDSMIHAQYLYQYKDAVLFPNENIRKLIVASDLVMTFFSTVGFEGILMKKPLITLNTTGDSNPVPWHNYGLATEVTNEEELGKAFNKSYDEHIHQLMEKYFSSILHGKSMGKTVNFINSLSN